MIDATIDLTLQQWDGTSTAGPNVRPFNIELPRPTSVRLQERLGLRHGASVRCLYRCPQVSLVHKSCNPVHGTSHAQSPSSRVQKRCPSGLMVPHYHHKCLGILGIDKRGMTILDNPSTAEEGCLISLGYAHRACCSRPGPGLLHSSFRTIVWLARRPSWQAE